MAIVELFHCLSARSFRPLWALEELEVPYELTVMDFPPRASTPHFLRENPLGTIPLMVHGETRMTESVAICQYLCSLASSTSLQVAPGEKAYGEFLNFLHFGEATLTFPQTLVLRYRYFEPAERLQPQVVEDYTRWFLSRLRALEQRLENQAFVCAERFTVADISIGYALMLAEHLNLAERFTPAVARYWSSLKSRDGFLRALAVERAAALEQKVSEIPAPLTRP